mmetsp:Transcript_148267/g.458303  ORF Transcript_148267/g.458303 Transcript_148267/m.458303 type:complete len:181 (+) Transcript_148267:76-618(+)
MAAANARVSSGGAHGGAALLIAIGLAFVSQQVVFARLPAGGAARAASPGSPHYASMPVTIPSRGALGEPGRAPRPAVRRSPQPGGLGSRALGVDGAWRAILAACMVLVAAVAVPAGAEAKLKASVLKKAAVVLVQSTGKGGSSMRPGVSYLAAQSANDDRSPAQNGSEKKSSAAAPAAKH